MMPPLPPILVAHLFPEISRRQLELLRSLRPEEWDLPTSSSERRVKDIVSHLLDGSLRRLAMQRDAYRAGGGAGQPRAGEPLIDFLNRLNREWEVAARRLSPRVLTELVAWSDPQLAALFQSLDPFEPAIFPVAWAGQTESPNWLDVARDYTEKWHHTQQIFAATGRPSTITERELFYPCVDTFLRALPVALAAAEWPEGTVVSVLVSGNGGGAWHAQQRASRWELIAHAAEPPASTVRLDDLTLWRLVTKRRPCEEVKRLFPQIAIEGDPNLGSYVLGMVAMMA